MPYQNEGTSYNSTTDELLADIRAALGGGGGGGGAKTEVTGGTAEIDGTLVTYSDKRAIYVNRKATAAGTIVVDGIIYDVDDVLPWFPDMGAGFKHRDITIDATGATGVVVNFFDA